MASKSTILLALTLPALVASSSCMANPQADTVLVTIHPSTVVGAARRLLKRDPTQPTCNYGPPNVGYRTKWYCCNGVWSQTKC
jgi:hypothetical protein